METIVREKIDRILEAHNRISELQNVIADRISQLIPDGSGSSHETETPFDVTAADLLDCLDQIEARTNKIEERLHQTLEKLNQIPG